MLPLTKAVPKELLPVGNKPMIQYAVAEAVAAGVEELIIVVNPKKKASFEAYFTGQDNQIKGGDEQGLRELQKLVNGCRISLVEQSMPHGLLDAIRRAESLLHDEPFLLLQPDNVYFGRNLPSFQLINCFEEYSENVMALFRVAANEARYFGNCGQVRCEPISDRVNQITWLQDKGMGSFATRGAEAVLRVCGRYLLTRDFFRAAGEVSVPADQELDDVPVLQKLIQKNKMLGVCLTGKLFDCGHWEGYWAANKYWVEHRGLWS